MHLRFDGVILGAGGRAVAGVQRVGEYVEIFEGPATGVIVPDIVDGPEVVFAGTMARMLSMGGTAGPMLVSVLNP